MNERENMGKWLKVLFWLVIPSAAGSVMTNQAVAVWLPFLYLPGQVISMGTMCVYGCVLLKLSVINSRYRTAGICCLLPIAADAAGILIPADSALAPALVLLSVLILVFAFYGEYSEYMGHAETVGALDENMAEKWKRLWKWFIGLFVLTLSSILLTAISPWIGITVVLVGMIGVLTVNVMKLSYLYRTAKIVQNSHENFL